MNRRDFLKRSGLMLGGLALCAASAQETLHVKPDLMNLERLEGALQEALGIGFERLEPSDKLHLEVPDFAESGLNVPVTCMAHLSPADLKALHIFVDQNPLPHIFTARFGARASAAHVETRIRLARSTTVRLIAETHGHGFLMAQRDVEVVVGGCG